MNFFDYIKEKFQTKEPNIINVQGNETLVLNSPNNRNTIIIACTPDKKDLIIKKFYNIPDLEVTYNIDISSKFPKYITNFTLDRKMIFRAIEDTENQHCCAISTFLNKIKIEPISPDKIKSTNEEPTL